MPRMKTLLQISTIKAKEGLVTDVTIRENECIMALRAISVNGKETINMGSFLECLCSRVIFYSQ